MVVWTSPYAPVFGDEELRLLKTLGALTGLALDRVRLFQAEHEARIALERADEVKTNFIALAAHELRTPMTTIHGFVTTLHHLADRLDDEQRQSVRIALLQQTQRMATLVEQLLDLSRLDAESIDIAPERVDVRSQVEEIVQHRGRRSRGGAHRRAGGHDRDRRPQRARPHRDQSRDERLPVRRAARARARRADRPAFPAHGRGRGNGVAPEFVPDLFERFTRSEGSRSVAGGTGLGLAIARSYARAHGGDLVYEDVSRMAPASGWSCRWARKRSRHRPLGGRVRLVDAAARRRGARRHGVDLDREALLRLARELAERRHSRAGARRRRARAAEAVAARARRGDRGPRARARRAPEAPRRGQAAQAESSRTPANTDALVARERAALERAQTLEARERELQARAAELEAQAEQIEQRELELATELALAQSQLNDSLSERELASAERAKLEERAEEARRVEKELAARRIELEQERERLEARAREVEARTRRARGGRVRAAGAADRPVRAARERATPSRERSSRARERELALVRQGLDAERNALLERERALRRREVADVRQSFDAPFVAPELQRGPRGLRQLALEQVTVCYLL